MLSTKMGFGNLNDIVEIEYQISLLKFEKPILKSITRHYQKIYGLSRANAEYCTVMNHTEFMRQYYERKYLPTLNIEMEYG